MKRTQHPTRNRTCWHDTGLVYLFDVLLPHVHLVISLVGKERFFIGLKNKAWRNGK